MHVYTLLHVCVHGSYMYKDDEMCRVSLESAHGTEAVMQ